MSYIQAGGMGLAVRHKPRSEGSALVRSRTIIDPALPALFIAALPVE
jgi:hypothetical protein